MSVHDDLLNGKEVLKKTSSEAEEHIRMCSFWQDEQEDVCSYQQDDTCGNRCSAGEESPVNQRVSEFLRSYVAVLFCLR